MSLHTSCFAVALMLSLPLSAREWTNQGGQKIEADYVYSTAGTVVLKLNGKDISYAIAKLSAADQAFIKEQAAAKPAAAAAATGWIRDFPIPKPAFAETKLYLVQRNAKAVYQAMAKGEFPAEWSTNKKDAKAEFAYDSATAKTVVYVPADHKWCVIAGDKDKNYAEIQKSSKLWEANRMNYKFVNVPGMDHSNAEPEHLEAAPKWLGL